MDATLAVVMLGAAAAGFVQGLTGFAFGLVAMAMWVWALPPALAAPLVVFGSLLGQVLNVAALRRGFDARRLAPFLLGGVLGAPLGVSLLDRVAPETFQIGVGALLVVWCPLMLRAASLPRVTAGGRAADAAAGLVGGIMGGLGGLSGPAPTLWATLRGWGRDAQRSVMQAFNLAMHSLVMAGYWVSGSLTAEMPPLFLAVAAAMVVPTLVGGRLYRRFSDDGFRRAVLVLLALSGAAMIVAAAR